MCKVINESSRLHQRCVDGYLVALDLSYVNCCTLTVPCMWHVWYVCMCVCVCVCVCVCCLWCRLQSSLPEHDLVVASYDVVRNDLSFFR